MEACGTSGMKAAMNGAFNLSISDGWWDEWYNPAFGWAIPSAEAIGDQAERDAAEAEAIYEIIEREIIPKFYTRDANGVPTEWVRRTKRLQLMRERLTTLRREIKTHFYDYLLTPDLVELRNIEDRKSVV